MNVYFVLLLVLSLGVAHVAAQITTTPTPTTQTLITVSTYSASNCSALTMLSSGTAPAVYGCYSLNGKFAGAAPAQSIRINCILFTYDVHADENCATVSVSSVPFIDANIDNLPQLNNNVNDTCANYQTYGKLVIKCPAKILPLRSKLITYSTLTRNILGNNLYEYMKVTNDICSSGVITSMAYDRITRLHYFTCSADAPATVYNLFLATNPSPSIRKRGYTNVLHYSGYGPSTLMKLHDNSARTSLDTRNVGVVLNFAGYGSAASFLWSDAQTYSLLFGGQLFGEFDYIRTDYGTYYQLLDGTLWSSEGGDVYTGYTSVFPAIQFVHTSIRTNVVGSPTRLGYILIEETSTGDRLIRLCKLNWDVVDGVECTNMHVDTAALVKAGCVKPDFMYAQGFQLFVRCEVASTSGDATTTHTYFIVNTQNRTRSGTPTRVTSASDVVITRLVLPGCIEAAKHVTSWYYQTGLELGGNGEARNLIPCVNPGGVYEILTPDRFNTTFVAMLTYPSMCPFVSSVSSSYVVGERNMLQVCNGGEYVVSMQNVPLTAMQQAILPPEPATQAPPPTTQTPTTQAPTQTPFSYVPVIYENKGEYKKITNRAVCYNNTITSIAYDPVTRVHYIACNQTTTNMIPVALQTMFNVFPSTYETSSTGRMPAFPLLNEPGLMYARVQLNDDSARIPSGAGVFMTADGGGSAMAVQWKYPSPHFVWNQKEYPEELPLICVITEYMEEFNIRAGQFMQTDYLMGAPNELGKYTSLSYTTDNSYGPYSLFFMINKYNDLALGVSIFMHERYMQGSSLYSTEVPAEQLTAAGCSNPDYLFAQTFNAFVRCSSGMFLVNIDWTAWPYAIVVTRINTPNQCTRFAKHVGSFKRNDTDILESRSRNLISCEQPGGVYEVVTHLAEFSVVERVSPSVCPGAIGASTSYTLGERSMLLICNNGANLLVFHNVTDSLEAPTTSTPTTSIPTTAAPATAVPTTLPPTTQQLTTTTKTNTTSCACTCIVKCN